MYDEQVIRRWYDNVKQFFKKTFRSQNIKWKIFQGKRWDLNPLKPDHILLNEFYKLYPTF